MTTRTAHPPEPEFYVCRHCREVLDDPQPAPFCSARCAAMWAFWQTSADSSLLSRFCCAEPPDVGTCTAWSERELYALALEVH